MEKLSVAWNFGCRFLTGIGLGPNNFFFLINDSFVNSRSDLNCTGKEETLVNCQGILRLILSSSTLVFYCSDNLEHFKCGLQLPRHKETQSKVISLKYKKYKKRVEYFGPSTYTSLLAIQLQNLLALKIF